MWDTMGKCELEAPMSILESARIRAGLTQQALSIQIGVDRSFISLVERGMRTTTAAVLHRWCEALGLTGDERSEALRLAGEAGQSGEAA